MAPEEEVVLSPQDETVREVRWENGAIPSSVDEEMGRVGHGIFPSGGDQERGIDSSGTLPSGRDWEEGYRGKWHHPHR